MRKGISPLALMIKSAWLFTSSFARTPTGADRYSGFQAFSVGSHHFVGALDAGHLGGESFPIE